VTEVAILGAGSGGLAAAADLVNRGYTVRLYNRSEAPLQTIRSQGGIQASGAVGHGLSAIHTVTTSLDEAVDGAEAILVVLPATAHGDIARALADQGAAAPIILNPGHMCGSLHVRRVFESAGRTLAIAELGTLTYVSRTLTPGTVDVYLRAAGVPFYTVPDDDEVAHLVEDLLPGQSRATHPMEVWFWDVNMVLHPPGMILGAARIESTGGEFQFYGDGITDSVETVMTRLDEERVEVARAFGAVVPRLSEAMATIGTADAEAARAGKLGDAIRSGAANATIKAPQRLDHRYLNEDIPFGLVPLAALGRIADVPTPVASGLIELAGVINGRSYLTEGLNEHALGIQGASVDEVAAIAGGKA
jgi:opine dehydrogenase